ncbi:glycosyltransferase family 39 protein [Patescibacteria group bacterium]|nr:glycosyltransferase family 39 protein [Patescibacteria group bacterium]
MSKRLKLFLVLILVLGILVRIYFIISIDFEVDEYQLVQGVKSITLQNVPVHFYGFGWGENTTLAYLALPFIKIFSNLHPIVIFRVLILLANLLFVFVLFHFVKLLFNQEVAVIAAAFALINPWSIRTSVIGFNAYLLPLIYTAAILFILLGINNKKVVYYIISFLLLALSFYTYAVSFMFVPLLIAIICFIYHKQINKRFFSAGIAVMFLFSLPIVLFYLKNQFNILGFDKFLFFDLPSLSHTRFSGVSVLNIYEGMMIPINYSLNYLLHFNILTLLTRGGNYFYGLVYFWDVFFILIAIFSMLSDKLKSSYKFLILWFVLGAAIPSFVDAHLGYSPTRDVILMPVLIIFSAYGFDIIIKNIKELKNAYSRSNIRQV